MEPDVIHSLTFSWTGWPHDRAEFPDVPASLFEGLVPLWRGDGFDVLLTEASGGKIQVTAGVLPDVAPAFFAARIKGRLDHAFRKAAIPAAFSRKVGARTLAMNTRPVVENYLRTQVDRSDLADPRYRASLKAASFEDPGVDLAVPSETNSGRYWYDLHLVFVTADRYRYGAKEFWSAMREAFLAAAREDGCVVKALAVMPDHVHIALRGNVALSPREIGTRLFTRTRRTAGFRVWRESFYAGSVGEYSLSVILD